MPTEPVLVQVDDAEHVATPAEQAQIATIREASAFNQLEN